MCVGGGGWSRLRVHLTDKKSDNRILVPNYNFTEGVQWFISRKTRIFQGFSGDGIQHFPQGRVQILTGDGYRC